MTASATPDRQTAGAILRFLAGFRQTVEGELRTSERLRIEYAADRVPCRRERLGVEIGHLIPFVRFQPGNQTYRGTSASFSATIPADATGVEIWFYSWNPMGCAAWDSRFGQNYRYAVSGPVTSADKVAPRHGAEVCVEIVNAFDESAVKVRDRLGSEWVPGSELNTRLSVHAWVRNLAYKNVWIDVHVYDAHHQRVQAGTLTLAYDKPAGGGGDLFVFSDVVYHGSGAVPGSVWNHPDARLAEYRLYAEMNEQIFTDGMLHTFELQPDEIVWNP